MIGPKEYEALDVLALAGLRRLIVSPAFYVRFARGVAKAMYENVCPLEEPPRAMQTLYSSDEEILKYRLADGFSYRGITVGLEPPDPKTPFNLVLFVGAE